MDNLARSSRNVLNRRTAVRFNGDALFARIARAVLPVCRTRARTFPGARRPREAVVEVRLAVAAGCRSVDSASAVRDNWSGTAHAGGTGASPAPWRLRTRPVV